MINDGIYKLVVDRIDGRVKHAGMQRKTLVTDNFTLEYFDSLSSKPSVLIIHGLGIEGKFQWYKQLKLLSSHYRVIMPNLLSFGNSRSFHRQYSIEDQVKAIQLLADELQLTGFDVMGISYGGLVAAELVRLEEHSFRKLLLMDAPVKFFDVTDIERIGHSLRADSLESLFVPSDADGLRKLFFAATGQKVPVLKGVMEKFQHELFGVATEEKRLMIKEMIAAINQYKVVDYSGIKVPVKLIWGEKDLLVPVERAKLLQKHIGSNADLSIIPGVGHVPNFQRSLKFNHLMMDFLSSAE